jgi:acetate kinase
MSADGPILALNAGSSSLKFALFNPADQTALRGAIENMDDQPHLLARDAAGAVVAERHWPAGAAPPFADLVEALMTLVETQLGAKSLAGVGHRVVNGGADHMAPARITPTLLRELEALTPLDPLHMPHSLAPMRTIAKARPDLAQVACFDTAFHRTMPTVASRIAVPRGLWAKGVRRYGFHGLSYDYIAGPLKVVAPDLARGRVIVAHLGAGASLCALLNLTSIATTMGFSALDGLVMATRCGSLDPGVILYLARQGRTVAEIETMLYQESGLLGVSEISGDMRVLMASDDPRAREAIELFTYRLATEAGGLVSALGGLDGLVFTAGVGENAPAVRAEICTRLAWLGLELDAAANAAGERRISTPASRIDVRVIPTDEEAMIARQTLATLGRTS